MLNKSGPIRLDSNRPALRPYRGGRGIERFRRLPPSADMYLPEDFLASTVATFGSAGEGAPTAYRSGLSVIGRRLLRDEVAADPLGYLGPDHVAVWGANTKLLCKLLHTGERLFVHVHPNADFAQRELGEQTGKTEAWIVLETEPGQTRKAWLGFRDDLSEGELTRWFDEQDTSAMLGALNEVPLQQGDTILVPAGLPHAIGPGVLILELQEPTDLSIILEYAPFDRLEKAGAVLGLDDAIALQAVDRSAISGGVLSSLINKPATGSNVSLLPQAAAPYFRAERISTESGPVHLDAQYAVLVVTGGAGQLRWDGCSQAVMAGDTFLIPFGAGQVDIDGYLTAIRCMPPSPHRSGSQTPA